MKSKLDDMSQNLLRLCLSAWIIEDSIFNNFCYIKRVGLMKKFSKPGQNLQLDSTCHCHVCI